MSLSQINKITPPRRLSTYLFGLGLVLVLGIGGYGYWTSQAPVRVFHAHFRATPESNFTTKDRVLISNAGELAAELRAQALRYHYDADYAFALAAWRAYLADYGEQDAMALLYASNAALASGRDELANWYLDRIGLAPNPLFAEELLWYRALHCVKQGQVTEAQDYLDQIEVPTRSEYVSRALPALRADLRNLR